MQGITVEVRCPQCNKKLGDNLQGGVYTTTCPRCKAKVVIDRREIPLYNPNR